MNNQRYSIDEIYDDFQVPSSSMNPVSTSHGRSQVPGTSIGVLGRPPTTSVPSPLVPPTSHMRTDPNAPVRPMTSKQGAGYTSSYKKSTGLNTTFDPLNQGRVVETPAETLDQLIKTTEKKIYTLIEESCFAAEAGKLQIALDKAKDAAKKERQLSKERSKDPENKNANPDITYCVLFNLANQFHVNKLYQEALNTYAVIVKNKQYYQSSRLRVNMGNIYFEQQKYAQAIKMYRMALDQVPSTSRSIRVKIMRNIGIALIKLGQYQDAAVSFESIMESCPDYQTAFNLILCYYALGDPDRMKKAFVKLVSLPLPSIDPDDQENLSSEDHDVKIMKDDQLKSMSQKRRRTIEQWIIHAARIIAPVIENSFQEGFDWTVETVKASQVSDLAGELEAAKAGFYLRSKEVQKAIETFQKFEKHDPRMLGTAATNLAFLFYLEGADEEAERYADAAIQVDRYNAKSLVNRGNCFFKRGLMEQAKQFYLDAINVDALCFEAQYNLGLTYKSLRRYEDALTCFEKLYSSVQNDPEVIFQIADIYDRLNSPKTALEWYNRLISLVPTDPYVLSNVADLYQRQKDKSQAFHYFQESHRYFPSNLDVLSWLGAYFVDNEAYEHAIQYFEKALVIQPTEIKWYLMIGSCLRRSGNYQHALDIYKKTHERFPHNTDCIHFLIRISTDLGLPDAHEYMIKLQQLERTGDHQSEEQTDAGQQPKPGVFLSSSLTNSRSLNNISPLQVNFSTIVSPARPDDISWDDDDVDQLLPD